MFNVLPIVLGSSVFVFLLLCITLCPFLFCNHLEEEEKAGCFAIIVFYRCIITINVLWLFLTVPWVVTTLSAAIWHLDFFYSGV